VASHVAAEAAALAARGHRVAVLAPASGRDLVEAGRARLRRAAAGDAEALLPPPGEVAETALARALPAGAGRRMGGPFDLAAALEVALASSAFDVVHVHEPLAPSPTLTALRHARGVTAATFHRPEQLAGVAFLRPLVDRALGRVDLRIATSEAGRRALAEVLPGEYRLIRPGVDLMGIAVPEDDAGPPGVLLVARGRDRVGARFGLSALRELDPATAGPLILLGPRDAPWRTRAAVPKALRGAVEVIPDDGPAARAAAFARARIAVFTTAADVAGPPLAEAMAAGMTVLAPLAPGIEAEGVLQHGRDALLLPAFSRPAWSDAIRELIDDAPRRRALGLAAAEAGRARGWDAVAAELEAAYLAVPARVASAAAAGDGRVLADLRVAPAAGESPAAIVAACAARGISVVAVAAPGGIEPALAVARAAPPELGVIVGQEIHAAEGVVVGLFLERTVPDGLPLRQALERVHAQGGVVLIPHPEALPIPPADDLRRVADLVDCQEAVAGTTGAAGRGDEHGAWLAQRVGMLVTGGSGAANAAGVGAAYTELRPFHGPADFLAALAEARVARRRRGGRTRVARRRRPPPDG
jgi:glycosyltransferase involved in cell wall biosynthesis